MSLSDADEMKKLMTAMKAPDGTTGPRQQVRRATKESRFWIVTEIESPNRSKCCVFQPATLTVDPSSMTDPIQPKSNRSCTKRPATETVFVKPIDFTNHNYTPWLPRSRYPDPIRPQESVGPSGIPHHGQHRSRRQPQRQRSFPIQDPQQRTPQHNQTQANRSQQIPKSGTTEVH